MTIGENKRFKNSQDLKIGDLGFVPSFLIGQLEVNSIRPSFKETWTITKDLYFTTEGIYSASSSPTYCHILFQIQM